VDTELNHGATEQLNESQIIRV